MAVPECITVGALRDGRPGLECLVVGFERHDRVRDESLPLTHEFLSLMLGVRRAGVTEALHSLESQKLIYTGTRKVAVRNRKGLERVAGSSYGTPETEFRRLIS